MMDELKVMPEVKEVHLVQGVYDIITWVESDTVFNARAQIRKLEKVRSMLTMIVNNVIV